MKDVAVTVRCNGCNAPCRHEDGWALDLPVSVGPTLSRVLDLCPSCHADLVALVESGSKARVRNPNSAPKRRTTSRRARAPRNTSSGDIPLVAASDLLPCPFCSVKPSGYVGRHGLRMHVARSHPEKAGEEIGGRDLVRMSMEKKQGRRTYKRRAKGTLGGEQ